MFNVFKIINCGSIKYMKKILVVTSVGQKCVKLKSREILQRKWSKNCQEHVMEEVEKADSAHQRCG